MQFEIWKAKIHCYTYIFKIGRLHCTPFVFLRFFPSKKKTCSWLVHLDLHCFFRQLDTQFASVKTILFLVHDPTNLYFGLASIFMHSGILLDPISQGTCKMTLTITIISEPYAHDKAAWNVLSTVIPHHILDLYASNWSSLTCPYTSSTPSIYQSDSSRHMYQVIMPNVCPTQVPSESFGRIGRVDAWWCHDLHERDPA